MDDYIPCLRGKPTFTKAVGNELWVTMIEKAWAKVHGNYHVTAGGLPHNSLRDLTGAPSYMEESNSLTPEKLLEWDKKGYLMNSAVLKRGQGMEEKNATGIVNQHAYSLIAVKKLKSPNVTLVQCRNPWGSFEWKGDWSDNSSKWTPALKKEVGFSEAKDDGLFWISYDDYVE